MVKVDFNNIWTVSWAASNSRVVSKANRMIDKTVEKQSLGADNSPMKNDSFHGHDLMLKLLQYA